MADPLIKQPSESKLYDLPFTSVMGASATITKVNWLVCDPPTVTNSSVTYSGQTVQVRLSNGNNGTECKVSASAQDNAGNAHEVDAELWVVDL